MFPEENRESKKLWTDMRALYEHVRRETDGFTGVSREEYAELMEAVGFDLMIEDLHDEFEGEEEPR